MGYTDVSRCAGWCAETCTRAPQSGAQNGVLVVHRSQPPGIIYPAVSLVDGEARRIDGSSLPAVITVCRASLWFGPPTCRRRCACIQCPRARDRARIGPKYHGSEGTKKSGGGDGHCRYADMRLSWAPGRDVSTRSSAACARPGIEGGSVPSWRMARRRSRRSERLGVELHRRGPKPADP